MKENKPIKHYIKNNNIDLEAIVKEYTSYVQTIIDNMISGELNPADKEEIASDTFFILWKNRERLDINKTLSSYIAGITRNLVKEKIRKNKNTLNILDYENSLGHYDKISFFDENIEEIKTIEKKLSNMKDIDKKIFKEFYYSSKSMKDIAKELDISEFNVKSRLYRIRKKIRKG